MKHSQSVNMQPLPRVTVVGVKRQRHTFSQYHQNVCIHLRFDYVTIIFLERTSFKCYSSHSSEITPWQISQRKHTNRSNN
jgi:hypothetical protein